MGSVVVAQGLRCSAACGIFPDQGSNPCPLHWQAGSQPLLHQGSPCISLCVDVLLILLDEYLGVELQGHAVSVCLTLYEAFNQSSRVIVLCYVPTNSV